MNYYIISSFINTFVSLFIGLFVFYKNPKAKINKSFFFWCLAVVLWSGSYFIWQLHQSPGDEASALFWSRALMLGAIWVPVAYFRLVCIFLSIEKSKRNLIKLFYAISFLFTVLLFTPLMVRSVEPEMVFRYWPKPGAAYAPFLCVFLWICSYAVYLSFVALKKADTLKRAQIKYMLIGIAISIIGASTNYLLWYDIPIKPYGNIFASIYVITTAYAIIRYRLMDVGFIIKRSTIFSVMTLAITATYILAAVLFGWVVFGGTYTFKSLVFSGLFVA
ncbi:MAG: hypothetical protein L6420_09325, partial [Elusimicrobia bacterium]|nr:hypothetical protein [Elusimicrobiota bacterium]